MTLSIISTSGTLVKNVREHPVFYANEFLDPKQVKTFKTQKVLCLSQHFFSKKCFKKIQKYLLKPRDSLIIVIINGMLNFHGFEYFVHRITFF